MLGNLSIKMKLIVSFTIIAVLVVLSSVTSIFDISKSSSGFENYRNNVNKSFNLTFIEENILLLNGDVKSYLREPSKKEFDSFNSHYEKIVSSANEIIKNSNNESEKNNIVEILSSLKNFKSDFDEVVKIMANIDDIYKNNLSINGKNIVELLSSIMITLDIEGNYEVSAQAGYAVRFMLLARLSTTKFIETSSTEEVKEINTQFGFLVDQMSDIKDEIKNETRIKKLNEAAQLIPIYKKGVDDIVVIIEKRNKVIADTTALAENVLNMISKIKDKSEEYQKSLGDEVTSLNSGIKNKTIIVGLIVLTLVIIFSVTISRGITKGLNGLNGGILNLLNSHDVSSRVSVISKDEIGNIAQNFNAYLQSIENGLKKDEKVIEDVKRVVSLIKMGKLKNEVIVSSDNKNLNELRILFNDMLQELTNKISTDIVKIEKALETFSKLDFRHRIDNATGKVEVGLNQLAEIINEMLIENKTNGLTIEESSKKLLENVENVSRSSTEAAASIEQTAAALDEITATIVNNTQSILKMAQFANELNNSAQTGKNFAEKTTVSMDEINIQVTSINDAINVIDEIAFQTNILSLNAAVEAATAGEAGKGFAVVAGEVRNLANRSAQAANEIKKLVESATHKANDGKHVSNEMIKGYELLTENIKKTLDLIKEVEAAFKEQQEGIKQINDSIGILDSQTQQNAIIANETKDIANVSQSISMIILEDANSKEFIGKENVDKRKHALDLSYTGNEKRTIEKKLKTTVKSDIKTTFKSNVKEDDWESF